MTQAEREKRLAAVEDALLRGIDRPGSLARMGFGTRRTCSKYVQVVKERWAERSLNANEQRVTLIEGAREVARRAWSVVASAANCEPPRLSAQCSALKIVLEAQTRIAKLSGLERIQIESTGYDAEELQAATIRLFGERGGEDPRDSMYGPVGTKVDPIREMYGVGPPVTA